MPAISPCIDAYRLSPMQQGLLFHSVSAPGSGVYVGQVVCRLDRTIDLAAFERAWQRAIDRHAILRTSFDWHGTSPPLQRVHRPCAVPIEQRDWRGVDAESLRALLEAERCRELDLRHPPLMRMALCRLPGDESLFVWTHHHLLLDGRARVIVLKDVARLYECEREGREPDLPPPPEFRAYIDWVWSQDGAAAEAFWKRLLGTFDSPVALSAARRPDPDLALRTGVCPVALAPDVATRLQSVAQQRKVTANIVVQGAWALLLSRYSGQRDVVFGATRSCRRAGGDGATAVVGVVMNTLPHRVVVDPDQPFAKVLDELRAQHVAIRPFEHTPLPQVRDWSGVARGAALFDTIVVFEERDLDSALRSDGGALWSHGAQRSVQTHYPLTLAGYTRPSLRLQIDYRRDLFDEGAVGQIADHLGTLLSAIAADPSQPSRDLAMLTPRERRLIVDEWNDTAVHVPDVSLAALVEDELARHPDAVAAVCDDRTLTCGELNEQANRLAHVLIGMGIGPEDRVAVAMPRSLDLVVALLGVLKSGAAYLPLDPQYPAEHAAYIVGDARPACLIAATQPPGWAAHLRSVVWDDPATVERLARARAGNPTDRERRRPLSTANLAYVIYTSGSTGRPKGVAMPHRAIVNKVSTLVRHLGFSPATRFAATTAISFDPLLDQIFCPLCAGGAVVVVPDAVRDDVGRFAAYAARHRITVLNATPGLVEVLMERGGLHLDTLMVGADLFPGRLANALRSAAAARRLLNMYGPTETCINASMYEVAAPVPPGSVPIGRALPNYQLYVIDGTGALSPARVTGELYIAGAGVARGYLNRPALTAERFVPDPFGPPGTLMYRTGDVVSWLPDGQLQFLGRADRQIKVRGVRIEPGEIESVLAQHRAVTRAVVVAHGQPPDTRLTAYVVTAEPAAASPDELRHYLTERLPSHMVPVSFVRLAQLPLTAHGKLDVGALPPPAESHAGEQLRFTAPRTDTERIVAAVWADVLRVERAGVCDSFFELGGDSLSAMQVMSRVRERLGVDLPIRALFATPTVEGLAGTIELALTHDRSGALQAVPA